MSSFCFITRHFILYLEENPNDVERRTDVEYNTFDCYSILYHNSCDATERKAYVDAFYSHFPQSKCSFEPPNPSSSITPTSFRHFLEDRLSRLNTICSDIQSEDNHTYTCLLHWGVNWKVESDGNCSVRQTDEDDPTKQLLHSAVLFNVWCLLLKSRRLLRSSSIRTFRLLLL